MKILKLKTIAAVLAVSALGFTAIVAQAKSSRISNAYYKAVDYTIINNTGIPLGGDNNYETNFSPDDFNPTIIPGKNNFKLNVVDPQTDSQLVFYAVDPSTGNAIKSCFTVNDFNPTGGAIYPPINGCSVYPYDETELLCTSSAAISSDHIYHVTVTIDKTRLK